MSSISTNQSGPIQIQEAGITESIRPRVNFVSGATVTDNPTNNSADIIISIPPAGFTELTGDVTAGPGSGSQVATLATVNSNVGTFVNSTVTVNAKGLVTAVTRGPLVVTKNNGYNILASDNGTWFNADTSSTTFTWVLPSPVSGFSIRISDSTGYFYANNFTLQPPGGVLLEGLALSKVFQTAWGSWVIYSDGTNYFIS